MLLSSLKTAFGISAVHHEYTVCGVDRYFLNIYNSFHMIGTKWRYCVGGPDLITLPGEWWLY